ncbi:hypothetical protein OG497_12845 [Streptomyces sp. NBC_01242]|uniref:hypothetical protein n=1 Tax=unclassified Streptomyces TaxID=2593676 RepID=UPI002252091E|nr:hypothetical protein [Streptomyces sp. NBC_01242]MCX4794976.1 hypothetical protein [Streptomyces sp. NBC_01242]WSU21816.1 hypothetical protein OG508_13135 [Streptomyces sp. NBC_01108]
MSTPRSSHSRVVAVSCSLKCGCPTASRYGGLSNVHRCVVTDRLNSSTFCVIISRPVSTSTKAPGSDPNCPAR